MSKGLEEDALLFRPIEDRGRTFYLTVAALLAVIAFAGFLYIRQIFSDWASRA